mmetsp:Transcript_3622/g.7539  ORF Transcript_3622/g.7539 Transcript_3622/m.7539 type:complete len:296 (+) Transcript_3622:71-958(+)|eukprot:6180316-Pleurochrysis_carterae.AAC.4
MLLLLPLSAALGWSLSPVQHSISFARPLSRVRRHGPSNDCLLGNRYTAAQTADRCSAEGVASRCRSTPAAPSMTASSNLKGFDEFVRTNPLTDRFAVKDFHHVEFICGDAKSLAAHWCLALGMQPVAHSNLMTGNKHYASHVISSGSVRFVLTAPYSSSASAKASEGTHAPSADGKHAESEWEPSTLPNPSHSADEMHAFFAKHGVSACAVGVHVEDAAVAYEQARSRMRTRRSMRACTHTQSARTDARTHKHTCMGVALMFLLPALLALVCASVGHRLRALLVLQRTLSIVQRQ